MIKFRPHHFFCTLGFQGKGYTPAFVRNYQSIVDELDDDTLIEVVEFTDDICRPCPHRRQKLCDQQTLIDQLDSRHSKNLSLKVGETLTWGEAKTRLKKLTPEDQKHMCQGCIWESMGVCAKALEELKSSKA